MQKGALSYTYVQNAYFNFARNGKLRKLQTLFSGISIYYAQCNHLLALQH